MCDVKKNSVHPIEVTDMNNLGYGVGRIRNMVCFLADGVPGDRGTVKIIKVAANYLVGKWERREESSPLRLPTTCPAFPRCGGCSFCHVDYATECRVKTDWVKSVFRKEGIRHARIHPPAGDLPITGYRNKALIPIAPDKNGLAYAGFFAPNTHRAVPCSSCLLQPEIFSFLTAKFVEFLNENHIPAYREDSDTGVVRHLYLRSVKDHSQVMLCAVVRDEAGFPTQKFARFAQEVSPAVVSVYLNVQPEKTNVVLGDTCRLLAGEPVLHDRLCDLDFAISPLSFYQINHSCAQRIYRTAAQLAELSPQDVLVDFYCGTGTIGLSMAAQVKEVWGIEVVEDAVANATANAQANGIANARFLCADAKDGVSELLRRGVCPTVAVIDPPRKGTTKAFIDQFCRLDIPKLIYISCNPATLARDLVYFEEKGYAFTDVHLFDMFPRTGHVESVVCLTRSEKAT